MQVCCLECAWANAWSLWLQGPARSYSILHYCSEGWASGYSASWAIHLWWVGICKCHSFTCFITACITNDVVVRILTWIIIIRVIVTVIIKLLSEHSKTLGLHFLPSCWCNILKILDTTLFHNFLFANIIL